MWAPNLTYADGTFFLVYSNVSTYAGGFTDCPNYVVTAPSIEGPWSDPALLHARGFDASLLHDGDESWLINLAHDWRPRYGGALGLEATRFDRRELRLVGEPAWIALPPQAGWVEGPNLYRIGDWYYLLTADGGTGYEHQVARPSPARAHCTGRTSVTRTGRCSPHATTPISSCRRRATAASCKRARGSGTSRIWPLGRMVATVRASSAVRRRWRR